MSLRTYPGYRRGPALRTAPMSGRAVVLSGLGHLGVLVAVVVTAGLWQTAPPTVYVVNLVPSVAAVGDQAGRGPAKRQSTTRESAPPRAARFTPRPLAEPPEATPNARPADTASISVPAPPAAHPPGVSPDGASPAAAVRAVPSLPDAPRTRSAPPASGSRPKLTAPSLPGQRPMLRPSDEERGLPQQPPDLRREPASRLAKLPPVDEAPRRPTLRDLPTSPTRRPTTLPGPTSLPGSTAPLETAPIGPVLAGRTLALPKAGRKELASPSPADLSPAPAPRVPGIASGGRDLPALTSHPPSARPIVLPRGGQKELANLSAPSSSLAPLARMPGPTRSSPDLPAATSPVLSARDMALPRTGHKEFASIAAHEPTLGPPARTPGPTPATPDLPAVARPPLSVRPVVLPRADQKEVATVASASPAVTPGIRSPGPAPVARATPPPQPAPVPQALGRATGSPQGFGTITMEASGFPFGWYLQAVQRKISEKWAPPPERVPEGRAVVRFEIGRDGQVRQPAMEDSSGDSAYDQAALRAIKEANPFPPLPAEFKEPGLLIHLGFNFAGGRG